MLLVTLSAGGELQAQDRSAVPPLPVLSLDAVPENVRTAIEAAARAAREYPESAAASGALGMLLHAHDQYDSAAGCYGRARRLEPASPQWAHLHGVALMQAGALPGAIAAFRDALSAAPDLAHTRLKLADALLQAGDVVAAGGEYERLLATQPGSPLAHYGLGRARAVSGDITGAADDFRRAVELAPDFGMAHYALATAYRQLGMPERAAGHLAAYREHGTRRPATPDPWMQSVQAQTTTARAAIAAAAQVGREGRLEDSVQLHLEALARDPAAGQAHVNLISLYGRLGRVSDARAHYEAAVRLGSNLPDAHYNYGVLLIGQGDLDGAEEQFRRALAANPFHAQAHYNLAGVLLRRGLHDAAVEHLREAVAHDPRHRAARGLLGTVLLGRGEAHAAIELLQPALDPDDRERPKLELVLGNAYAATGAIDRARAHLAGARARAARWDQPDIVAAVDAAERALEAVQP